MHTSHVLLAFGLTLLAGLSTGIGSLLALFTRQTNKKFLCLALGFSAGVMVYVSFVELFAQSRSHLVPALGGQMGYAAATACFFAGMALAALVDRLVPSHENPHEAHRVEEMQAAGRALRNGKLLRMGMFSALAITIHNFPEGLATFTATLAQPSLGVGIAVAIAIHNIPEGIAVAVPVFFATGSRSRAFWLSFLSGLAEPLGALVGFAFLMPYLNDTVFGLLFGSVAGIMVYISFDELLPAAQEYGEHHLAVLGVFAGMAVMAASLVLLT